MNKEGKKMEELSVTLNIASLLTLIFVIGAVILDS
ncbi:putative membrane protein [Anoxybacillus sp. B7M1]|jgi:hypothetical protein|nr:putative membrane protein [Anoxybacillus sp. B2M1]ANB65394.1 putative membrane protein [Anoxybacillus sp. B7M1]